MAEQTLSMKWKLGETRTQTAQPLHYGELAQLARAFALHAKGQRFDSVILHMGFGDIAARDSYVSHSLYK